MTKRRFCFTFFLLICFSLPLTATAQTVNIPDPHLRVAIAIKLGVASGAPITVSDMANLTELEAQNDNITDLTGLEAATNLRNLNLGDKTISGFAENNNAVSNLSPLSGLTNLIRLDLEMNAISNISVLTNLTNLVYLDLSSNSISDISPLKNLKKLEYLDLGGNFISDISVLAGLTNLTQLYIGANAISNISPLAGLTNLTRLSISSNAISNISALQNLTNLWELGIAYNSISDISVLAGLINLSYLTMWNNTISDISPLVENTGLGRGDTAHFGGNPLDDASIHTHIPTLLNRGVTIGFPADIPDSNLRAAIEEALDKTPGTIINVRDFAKLTHFEAASTNISNLTGLQFAVNLTILNLEGNTISDISPLTHLTNLTWLQLPNNNIADISPLVANTGLGSTDRVNLRQNPLNDASIHTYGPTLLNRGVTVESEHIVIEPVDIPDRNLRTEIARALGSFPDPDSPIFTWQMANLTELQAKSTDITDLTGLEYAINLTHLNLGEKAISDISLLANLTNLTELYLRTNSISDISPLAGLTNLRILELRGNSISDISPLAGLTNLTFLSLWNNSISDISPLAGLTNLTELSLEINSISDISPLAGLTNLTRLFLQDNSISDISPVVANTGLESGDLVNVGKNPLNFASINTHIPALRSRRVGVYASNLKPVTSEYTLSMPAGISLIHVPLKVTEVDGAEQTIGLISDLYDALGGAGTVNFLITYDSISQEWYSYFVPSDKGGPADSGLGDDTGIIVGLRTPVSVHLRGTALGTNTSSTITLNQGLNVVGLPLNDSRVTRVSDLLKLDGIGGNVPVIILTDGGEFKLVGRAGDPGDIAVTGGQAFIMTASRSAMVAISGDAWANESGAAAAPPVTLKGVVGDTTPVLGFRGSIVDKATGLKAEGFRVTVKNLSTRRAVSAVATPDEAGYRSTVVDIERGRAATVGDILEISARSANPFIGVEPLQYTVTAEDVKQSLIQLPELVAYEIPAETQLLRNYPNPFNPETWIPYRLAEDAFVTLTIYDLNGQIVRTLDVGHQTAAVYENRSKAVYWDGRNELGEQVASGVYFYHLSAGEFSATRKMVILK